MALYGASGSSHGLGYGRPTTRAILGETLSVIVPIHLEAGEDVANDCLAADVYFGDDKLPGGQVQAAVLPGGGSNRVIKIVTTKFVNEPVITLYLAAGCNAKITRKFVAFADPPGTTLPSVGLNEEDAAPVAYAAKPGKVTVGGLTIDTGGAIASAPMSSADDGPRIARRPKKPTSAASAAKRPASGPNVLQGAPSLALSADAAAQSAKVGDDAALGKHRGAGKSATVTAPQGEGGRLVLDPVDIDAVILPSLKMTAAMQGKVEGDDASAEVKERRVAAEALWRAMNLTPEETLRDRLRMQELEKRLASLQQDAQKAQQQVAQLQARVKEAESVQSSPALVYGLGGLVLLLGGAVAVLFLKDRRKSGGADWWKAEAPASTEPRNEAPADESPLEQTLAQFRPGVLPASEPAPAATPPAVASPAPVREAPPTFSVTLPPSQAVAPAPAARAARPALSDPPREVSVEELIDLEQQAEFFIVLGQDDAALDLLESHVQSTTGASPLPFLKLLEIYQRLGKRQDYERVQGEFNQRFNGYAPAWESDLQQGHSLSEYPGIVERLQALWPIPAQAMDVLERSLTRPDAEVETFDLPAYRELLFLYAVARDLSEREVDHREAVDLNALPSIDPSSVPVAPEAIEPLMATRPVKAQPQAQPTISLDLSLDDLEPMDMSGGTPNADAPTPLGNDIEFEHVDIDSHKPTPPSDKA